jgi:two-component system, LuxR family, response regulator FixJ
MASQVIFVVDDDPSVRVALRRLLLSLRLPTRLFGSAEEFLAQTQSAETGCILLDVALPGMDGLQLQDQLARDGRNLPVIFITALEDDDGQTRDAAMRNGAVDFLRKPFERERLLRSVRTALGQDDVQDQGEAGKT